MQLVGIDEVGRGALAGPVFVGAVVLPEHPQLMDELALVLKRTVADSKQLTKFQRERAAIWLAERVAYGEGQASAGEIDQLGIVAALRLAAGRALDSLAVPYTHVQADAGLFHPYEATVPTERFIKGDETIPAILCASILVKVARDARMRSLAQKHSVYGWEQNVGYGTAFHLAALREYGLSAEHRPLFCRNVVR